MNLVKNSKLLTMNKLKTCLSMKLMIHGINDTEIDFQKIQDIIYWTKKWEISAYQLIDAFYTIKTNKVSKIEEYLRSKGFAL